MAYICTLIFRFMDFTGDFMQRSYLILIGGAEDKTGNREILKQTVKISGAKSIVVIPTASAYPRDVFTDYYYAFKELGVEQIECFDIRKPEEADTERNLELIRTTDLVFFSGGDQVKLVETLKDSQLLKIIKERFYSGTLPIAGTSAGAAAASDYMLYDGDYKGFMKGAVTHTRGFGFIENITVDTHFLHRERIPRLVDVLSSPEIPNTKGIGLDENTAIVIGPNLRMWTIGSGMVTVINTEFVTFSDYDSIEKNSVFSINNLRIGFLAPGTMFSTKRWSVLKSDEAKKKFSEMTPEHYSYLNMILN
ncbi:MAG: cyanophycinase [Bacteroidales bacterium]|nr:cyanophycinase [Bacteroidales bacterium]